MANAADMALTEPLRILLMGYPGSAKTGMLAQLANIGYKIRMLDFEANTKPLVMFTKPEFRKNIDILSFEDELRGGTFIETVGMPTAFARALNAMDDWKYTTPKGEVNLGKSKEWGCDTVVVLDSLTAMGIASKRRAMRLSNKTPLNMTDGVWNLSMMEQEAFIEKLTAGANNFHVIVLSHLKMQGPPDVRKGDDDVTREIKSRLVDLLPTRLYPSALGRQLPPMIAGNFPIAILAETQYLPGGKMKRVIATQPREELDLKMPSTNIPAVLPMETGLVEIFKELAPPLEGCLGKTPTA